MANVNLPVAGFIPVSSRNNKFPRIALSTTEVGYIMNCAWCPSSRMKIELLPTGTTLLIHSVAGLSQTDGLQIAAGGKETLLVQHGDIIYMSGLAAGFLDVIQVDL